MAAPFPVVYLVQSYHSEAIIGYGLEVSSNSLVGILFFADMHDLDPLFYDPRVALINHSEIGGVGDGILCDITLTSSSALYAVPEDKKRTKRIVRKRLTPYINYSGLPRFIADYRDCEWILSSKYQR